MRVLLVVGADRAGAADPGVGADLAAGAGAGGIVAEPFDRGGDVGEIRGADVVVIDQRLVDDDQSLRWRQRGGR